MTYQLKAGNYPVVQVENNTQLIKMADSLSKIKAIGFDTEFDKSKRGSRFSLLLIQVFDGTKVYLIKVNKSIALSPLFKIFENSEISKIGFSLVEDIRLLKLNGCNPVNVIDLKVISKFSEYNANSYSHMVRQILNIELDKSKQTSNWNKKQLDFEQILYAAKDVIYLLELYQLIMAKVYLPEFHLYIKEELVLLENTEKPYLSSRLTIRSINNFHTSDLSKKDNLNAVNDKTIRRKLIKAQYTEIKKRYTAFLLEKNYKEHTIYFVLEGLRKLILNSKGNYLDDYRSKLYLEFTRNTLFDFNSLFI